MKSYKPDENPSNKKSANSKIAYPLIVLIVLLGATTIIFGMQYANKQRELDTATKAANVITSEISDTNTAIAKIAGKSTNSSSSSSKSTVKANIDAIQNNDFSSIAGKWCLGGVIADIGCITINKGGSYSPKTDDKDSGVFKYSATYEDSYTNPGDLASGAFAMRDLEYPYSGTPNYVLIYIPTGVNFCDAVSSLTNTIDDCSTPPANSLANQSMNQPYLALYINTDTGGVSNMMIPNKNQVYLKVN